MERKGRIQRGLLIILAAMAYSCSPAAHDEKIRCVVYFDGSRYTTKALNPDERKITDISLMVFDEAGDAEECIWIPKAGGTAELTLVKGKSYDFRACANFGYQVYADHISELEEITFYMAYPDEYQEGMPMFASADDVIIGADGTVHMVFDRLMSKISIRMDRSRLSDGVEMYVRSARICNCPKVTTVFVPNKVTGSDKCHNVGFYRNDNETSILNLSGPDGKSGEIAFYMLENMQGNTEADASACSYIEMELDYMSDTKYSTDPLKYRFYLGDGKGCHDIERNTHYRILVCPEDDGLSDDDWRVDKEGLRDNVPVTFASYPSSYIRGNIGDNIHIWCEFTPEDTPFDVGEEYMKDDKANGIYDYEIDPDGHGATLTLTGPGRGMIYMSAGKPVDESALYVIEVNLPGN